MLLGRHLAVARFVNTKKEMRLSCEDVCFAVILFGRMRNKFKSKA